MSLEWLSPSTWVNFGIAVAVGRFASDVAFYHYRQRVEEGDADE